MTATNNDATTTAAAPAHQPTNLGEYQEAVASLRKLENDNSAALAEFESHEKELAAASAEIKNFQSRKSEALIAAFTSGRRELPDHQRRAFDDEERQIMALSSEFDTPLETLEAIREKLHEDRENIAAAWADLRRVGRELYCQKLAAAAARMLERASNPRSTVADIVEGLESARDICAAHEAFRNPSQARTVVGLDIHPEYGERMVFGQDGKLSQTLGLTDALKKFKPLDDSLTDTPDQARAVALIEEGRDFYMVPPYTAAERTAEWDSTPTPAERKFLAAICGHEDKLSPAQREETLERRERIEQAQLRLARLRRAAF